MAHITIDNRSGSRPPAPVVRPRSRFGLPLGLGDRPAHHRSPQLPDGPHLGEGRGGRGPRERGACGRLGTGHRHLHRGRPPVHRAGQRRRGLAPQPLLLLRPLLRHRHGARVPVRVPPWRLRPRAPGAVHGHPRRPRAPCPVPAGATQVVPRARVRRHAPDLRTQDLRQRHGGLGGQPDRGDAIAARRVGDHLRVGARHRPQQPVALAGAAASDHHHARRCAHRPTTGGSTPLPPSLSWPRPSWPTDHSRGGSSGGPSGEPPTGSTGRPGRSLLPPIPPLSSPAAV